MFELNSRMCIIILKSLDSGIEISDLYKMFDVTKRTLYYDISKISDYLNKEKLGIIEISNNKVQIFTDKAHEIRKKIQNKNNYIFSIKERKAIIFLYSALCTNNDKLIIKQFEEIFEVSKNTVLNDIKSLKNSLKFMDIELVNTNKRGYYFIADEQTIRNEMMYSMQKLPKHLLNTIIRDLIQNSLEKLTMNEIDFFELVALILKNSERELGTKFVISHNKIELFFILGIYIRGLKNNFNTMDDIEKNTLSTTAEYKAIKKSINKIQRVGIPFPIDEICSITPLLLGIKRFNFSSPLEECNYITNLSEKFIDNFERISNISFNNKELLISDMNTHVKQLLSRLKYNIRLENPILDEIKKMYPFIFENTCKSLKDLDNKYFDGVAEDEIAYLCIYIASHLKKYSNHNGYMNFERKKVLVVCAAGVASSILIKNQLETKFLNLFEYDLKLPEAVNDEIIENYIFVISSVKLKQSSSKIVNTKLILTDENIKEILKILIVEYKNKKFTFTINELLKILEKKKISEDLLDDIFLDILLDNQN